MAPTKKIRKPVPPAKFKTYSVPKDQKTSLVGYSIALDTQIIQTKNFEDIYSLILGAFSKLSKSSEMSSIKLFAKKCKDYASNLDYKQECKNSYEIKKTQLADLEIERKTLNLAQKGMHSAIRITDSSISKVTKRTLSVLDEDSYRDIRGDDEREEEDEKGEDEEEGDEEEGNESSDDNDERVWREILDSRKRSVLGQPSSSQYTPEKPKLTLDMISKLGPSFNLALSCVPLSKIPVPLLNIYQQHRNDQFNLKSLRGEPTLHAKMIEILDVEDNDNNRANFAFELWKSEKEARDANEKNLELYKMFGLCLTDFWGICFQDDFRKDHARSFWVERIVPLFKYLGASDQVVFSCFQVEDFEHSIGDTYKIVGSMSSSLNTMLRQKQDCKLSSVRNLAVYGIQCIKSKLTLMKTTLDPHSDRFQIVELRSASIPTAWAQRTGMIRVFELLVCLHNELKEQRLLEDLLVRQQNQIIPVDASESLRYMLQHARHIRLE
ncbi:hypothetical protein EDC94DRAFT_677405 [Helicostylum pulchrum]|nr:hypothetical protein EDC94DRAFT_677405 [Helicostylum pulchrum]